MSHKNLEYVLDKKVKGVEDDKGVEEEEEEGVQEEERGGDIDDREDVFLFYFVFLQDRNL